MKRLLTILTLSLSIALLPGCSWFQGACTKAMPSITQGQANVGEAILSVQQVVRELSGVNLTTDELNRAIETTSKANAALRAIEAALDAAAGACTTIDVVDLFKEFVTIWGSIELLFAAHPKLLAPTPHVVMLVRRVVVK